LRQEQRRATMAEVVKANGHRHTVRQQR
jgi:hypothetical protein